METIDIKISTNAQTATNEMSNFRKEIQELRGKLLTLDESTEEYSKTLGELANKQFQLREMNENVRYSVTDLGEQLKTVTRIGKGVAAGFNVVQSTMALFGAESESLSKMMVRLQAGIALVQGLEGLEGLGKTLKQASIQFGSAFKAVKTFIGGLTGLRATIAATGIGALVVAVGLLAANWDKVTEAVRRYIGAQQDADAIINRFLEKQERLLSTVTTKQRELNREIAIMQANGDSEVSIAEKKLELAKETYEAQRNYVAELERQYNSSKFYADQGAVLTKQQKKDLEELPAIIEEAQKLSDNYKQAWLDASNTVTATTIKNAKAQEKADIAATNARIKAAEEEAKAKERLKENDLKRIAEINRAAEISLMSDVDAEIARLTDTYNEQLALYQQYGQDTETLTAAYNTEVQKIKEEFAQKEKDRLIKDFADWKSTIQTQIDSFDLAANKTKSEITPINELDTQVTSGVLFDKAPKMDAKEVYERQVEINNAELQAEQEKYEAKRAFIEQQLQDETLTNEQRTELNNQLKQAEIDNSNAILANEKKNAKEKENLEKAKRSAVEATLSTTSNALKQAAAIAGEESKAGKALAVAAATIDTFQAAVSSYNAMAGIPIVGPALGAIAAATAITSGIMNVRSILKVNEKGENSAPSGGSAASTPNISSSMLSSNIYGTQLSDLTEIELQNAQSDTRVYVVESDITDSQNAIKTQVDESTF